MKKGVVMAKSEGMRKFTLIGLALLVCALPAQADMKAGTRVPAPTAANQVVYSGSTAPFTWQPVSLPFAFNGTGQMAVGGALDTGSRLSVSPSGAAENGVKVVMPSGATGYGYSLYSSTGVLLSGQSSKGVGIFTGGQPQGTTIGGNASNALSSGTVIGNGATGVAGSSTFRQWGVAIGGNTNITDSGIAIGYGAVAKDLGVAIGSYITAQGYCTAINGTATGLFSTALGLATASGSSSFGVGYSATASGYDSIAVGTQTQATGNGSIAFGNGVTATNNQFIIGSNSPTYGISQTYIGDGAINASPLNTTLNATGGSGTNIAGANLTLAGGQSTGTGAEGTVSIATSGSGATGTTLNALTNRVAISQMGLTVLGTGTVNSPAYAVGGTAGYTGTIPTTAQSLSVHGGIITGFISSAGTQVGNP